MTLPKVTTMSLIAYHNNCLVTDRRFVTEMSTGHTTVVHKPKFRIHPSNTVAFGYSGQEPSPATLEAVAAVFLLLTFSTESPKAILKEDAIEKVIQYACKVGGHGNLYVIITHLGAYRLDSEGGFKALHLDRPFAYGSGCIAYETAALAGASIERAVRITSRVDLMVSPEYDVVAQTDLVPFKPANHAMALSALVNLVKAN